MAVAATHLVEGGMGKDEDLVRHGDHVDVLRKQDDERAAVQRVDEPLALKQLGHRALAQRHVETCVHDRTRAGPVVSCVAKAPQLASLESLHSTKLPDNGRFERAAHLQVIA